MGPDTANIPKAFALGRKLCEESGVNELTLVIPSKGNLSSIVVGEFLGEAASKRLMAGETDNNAHQVRHGPSFGLERSIIPPAPRRPLSE